MRDTVDFSPFYRSSIGFDRLFDLLESGSHAPGGSDRWPPYDIVKMGDDSYRITIAVAGFSETELTVTHEPNLLLVNGAKAGGEQPHYLHHGLALRPFSRRFELADHVNVEGARLENGLLVIDLKKELPESMRPQRIGINTGRNRNTVPERRENEAAA